MKAFMSVLAQTAPHRFLVINNRVPDRSTLVTLVKIFSVV